MGAKNMTREARDMELQWFDIRELTEDAAQTVIGMMDETRRRRVADIAGEDDRKRTIAGELLARRMLAQTMGCAEKDVPLQWDELGKPSVEKDGVYVSVSHSGPWAVCVTADAPVGVDVEVVRSAQEKFMRRVCSEQEMAYIRSGDDGDCQRFWEIWTAKEALFKLTGKGPLLALSRFSLPAGWTIRHKRAAPSPSRRRFCEKFCKVGKKGFSFPFSFGTIGAETYVGAQGARRFEDGQRRFAFYDPSRHYRLRQDRTGAPSA